MQMSKLYADSFGVHVILPTLNEYTIEWWQIAKDGAQYWLRHLKAKRWFSTELSKKFMAICQEHNEMFLC